MDANQSTTTDAIIATETPQDIQFPSQGTELPQVTNSSGSISPTQIIGQGTALSNHMGTPIDPPSPEQTVDLAQTSEKLLEGEVVEKHAGGRPTKYNEEMVTKIQEYFEECFHGVKGSDGKYIKNPRTPFIEELQLLLDINDDTINEWAKQPDKQEFSATYMKLKLLQKLRLKQIIVKGKSNPVGPKFLLEAEHGLIASEKKILTGEPTAPLQIEITEEQGKKQLMEEATT